MAILAIQTLALPHTALANENSAEETPSFLLVQQSKRPEANSLAEILLKAPEEAPTSTAEYIPAKSFISGIDTTQTPDQPVNIPTPLPTAAPAKPDLNTLEGIKQRICEVFPQHECNNALAIVYAESKFDTWATSPQNDRGLFQVNCYWHKNKLPNQDCQQLYDPETNIQVAFQIWSAQGWCPWATKHVIGVYCGY